MIKKIYSAVSLLFIVHFLIISVYLFEKLEFYPFTKQTYSKYYVSPFFSQNWAMFAPNPPQTNTYVLVRFKIKSLSNNSTFITPWYDSHSPVNDFNKKYIFSIAQRLSKYFNTCIMSVYQVNNRTYHKSSVLTKFDSLGRHKTLNQLIVNDAGFLCLRQYARQLFNQISKSNNSNNVSFQLRFINEGMPLYKYRHNNFFDPKNHPKKAIDLDFFKL